MRVAGDAPQALSIRPPTGRPCLAKCKTKVTGLQTVDRPRGALRAPQGRRHPAPGDGGKMANGCRHPQISGPAAFGPASGDDSDAFENGCISKRNEGSVTFRDSYDIDRYRKRKKGHRKAIGSEKRAIGRPSEGHIWPSEGHIWTYIYTYYIHIIYI